MSNKLHVKKDDTVLIISGDDRGKTGKVLAVSPKEGKVIVEGLNMVKKHVKPRKAGDNGGIIEAEGAIYASKVEVVLSLIHISTLYRRQFRETDTI